MRQCSTAKRGVERQLAGKAEDFDREIEVNKNMARLNSHLASQVDTLQLDLARTSRQKEIKDEQVELLADECEELILDLASTSIVVEIKETQLQLLDAECQELISLCTTLERLEAENQRQIRDMNARIAQLERERSASLAQQQEETERANRQAASKQEEIDKMKLKHDTLLHSVLPKVIRKSVAFSRQQMAEHNAHLEACATFADLLEGGQINQSASILEVMGEAFAIPLPEINPYKQDDSTDQL